MLDLHAIAAACDNPPGLKHVAIVLPSDLEVQPRYYAVPSVLELQFKSGKAAYGLSHEVMSANLASQDGATTDGDVYDYDFRMFVPKVRPDVDFLRAKLRNTRVHLLCTYMNDTRKFVPKVRLFGNEGSGDRSSKNGYSFSGKSRLLKPAPWINGVVNIIGPPYEPPGTGGGTGGSGFEVAEIVTAQPSHTHAIQSGKFLMAIFVKSNSAQTVSIGYSAGSAELGGPTDMLANTKYQFGSNWLLPDTQTNIYITGLAGINTIEICVL